MFLLLVTFMATGFWRDVSFCVQTQMVRGVRGIKEAV